MAGAFELVPGVYALVEGCPTRCEVRKGTMGVVSGNLYVNTGYHFRLMTEEADGSYKDDLGRRWIIFEEIDALREAAKRGEG